MAAPATPRVSATGGWAASHLVCPFSGEVLKLGLFRFQLNISFALKQID